MDTTCKMQPDAYCSIQIERLQQKRCQDGLNLNENQLIVVLTHFLQLNPAANDFESQLKLLVESASRSNRTALATAARSVLDDWQAESRPLITTGR
jgi:hypothetical protein